MCLKNRNTDMCDSVKRIVVCEALILSMDSSCTLHMSYEICNASA